MHNRLNFTQQDIRSFHWLKFPGQNGEYLYALSGVILVDTKGDSQNWHGAKVNCKINIPELPAGMGLYIRYHAPFAALNSVYNQNVSNNSGHSVNTFNLVSIHPGGNYGAKEITLEMDLAVRDSDAYLHRVGFSILFTGYFRPLPPVDPCQAEKDKLDELERGCNGGYQALKQTLEDSLGDAASPQEKEAIRKHITELSKKIQSCPVDLGAARQALNQCRIMHPDFEVPPMMQ